MFALICRLAGAVPLAGEALSQGESEESLKLSVPEPVLLMLTLAAAGLAPPCVAVKETASGETESTGWGPDRRWHR